MSNRRLPAGDFSAFSTLNTSFAFHASPEVFITSRILAAQQQTDSDLPDGPNQAREVIGARILNRRVAVLSSHAHVQQVLLQPREGDDEPACVAGEAYHAFMAPFFPAPNLLLADGAAHAGMRPSWESRVESVQCGVQALTERLASEHFGPLCAPRSDASTAAAIDLYESMKQLSWKLVLGFVLGLAEDSPDFVRIQRLQEELLRGQFSLFPVSVSVGWWKSPRQKGIAAKVELQRLIFQRLSAVQDVCPFNRGADAESDAEMEEVANHVLLFTSSLSVKSVASLLTAFLLNLMLFERDAVKLRDRMDVLEPAERHVLLTSVMKETQRLSPPVVGVMRRVTADTVLKERDGSEVLIPKGWDMWLYFAGAARDIAAYGANAGMFVPQRFMQENVGPEDMAFSAGPKRCLGKSLVQEMVLAVGQTALDLGIRFDEPAIARGVRGWLGWEDDEPISPEDWARDMKQLPTQRPAEPVVVHVHAGEGHALRLRSDANNID